MTGSLETATAAQLGSSITSDSEKRLMITAGRASRELGGRIATKLDLERSLFR